MINQSALTVTQLNTYIKMLVDSDALLRKVFVVGEISNFVNHFKTGHCYFTIKDEASAIKAVMFAGNARTLKFRPENGMRVYITGRISVFERDGVYQIYAEKMEPEGAGSLMIAFEQLKKKLSAEGLFDDEVKKPLPQFPGKIAVLTSAVGAAYQDILNVITRRYPLAEIILCPVAVQGINCARENIDALNKVNKLRCADVIIMARGGGSIEDLWGYNDEQLVRAVAQSDIPVITGVGHETDFTLCDFAADMRAPTPSAAAEICVPDIYELYQLNDSLYFRLNNAINIYLNDKYSTLSINGQKLRVYDPGRILETRNANLSLIKSRIDNSVRAILDTNTKKLDILSHKLELLNPMMLISKGYIPVTRDKQRVVSAGMLSVNDDITLAFSDGDVRCVITDIIPKEQ
ncbi:MAG: exodeoxyribonuclease VII large subunit [Clostridia bacterium]|nr:exodeoxyribonuclease VII large subunit [Clostridia bacterium]